MIRWMISEAFKLKGLSKQVHNDFIREAGERLQARLAREAEEKSRREAEEKAHLKEEQRVREAAENEVDAEAKVDVEEAAHIVAEEATKESNDALAQGEPSHSDFSPLVMKTLEELQKEQQIARAILDQQYSVNNNI